jgi:hypothetical protein
MNAVNKSITCYTIILIKIICIGGTSSTNRSTTAKSAMSRTNYASARGNIISVYAISTSS